MRGLPEQSRRIAIFGGTFDPVHDGHLALAAAARVQLDLDEVRFLPCRISPHKTSGHQPAPAVDRLAMLELAIAGLEWARVSGVEVAAELADEAVAPPSFSYLTAEMLVRDEPHACWFWLMGADQWRALPRWKHPERLAALVTFAVMQRQGEIAFSRDGYRMVQVHGEHLASSTAIRSAIEAGENAAGLPPKVAEFIRMRGLYRGGGRQQ